MEVQIVRIKYDGELHEFQASNLDMGTTNPSDNEVIASVMVALDTDGLTGYVVDPPESERNAGNHDDKVVLDVRPSATYGI